GDHSVGRNADPDHRAGPAPRAVHVAQHALLYRAEPDRQCHIGFACRGVADPDGAGRDGVGDAALTDSNAPDHPGAPRLGGGTVRGCRPAQERGIWTGPTSSRDTRIPPSPALLEMTGKERSSGESPGALVKRRRGYFSRSSNAAARTFLRSPAQEAPVDELIAPRPRLYQRHLAPTGRGDHAAARDVRSR